MRRTLATTLAATALSLGAARAADMSFKAPPPVAPPFSWAGFYAGANAGGAWDDSGFAADPGQYMLSPFAFRDNAGAFTGIPGILVFVPGTFPLPGRVAVGSNRGSFLGGVQVGYNWQFGTTVLGLEGQIDSLKASRS
jgi:outer membrane immunogenic protein